MFSFPYPLNDPARAGATATVKFTFGERNRYALYAVHTRFSAVMWFVSDAETVDEETGLASIVWQSDAT